MDYIVTSPIPVSLFQGFDRWEVFEISKGEFLEDMEMTDYEIVVEGDAQLDNFLKGLGLDVALTLSSSITIEEDSCVYIIDFTFPEPDIYIVVPCIDRVLNYDRTRYQ